MRGTSRLEDTLSQYGNWNDSGADIVCISQIAFPQCYHWTLRHWIMFTRMPVYNRGLDRFTYCKQHDEAVYDFVAIYCL